MLQLCAESTPLVELAQNFSEGQGYNYWGEFVNMIITLMIVVGLIFVSIVVLKKILRSRVHQLNRGAQIKILERRAINQKASLYLVNIGGKVVMIGESPAGLHLITELPDFEMEEEVSPEPIGSKLRGWLKGHA